MIVTSGPGVNEFNVIFSNLSRREKRNRESLKRVISENVKKSRLQNAIANSTAGSIRTIHPTPYRQAVAHQSQGKT